MAKDDKGKIRFVIFELEGSNETLQESMRTVVQALGRAPAAPQRIVTPAPPAITSNGTHPQLTMEDEYAEEVEETPAVPVNNKRSKQVRHYAKPKVIEVDLTSGDMPFKTYCQDMNLTSHIKKYLVIAAWFKLHRNLDAITNDHVYTCYRTMNWNVLADIAQSFRQGKSKGWFDNTQVRGSYAINHVGLNQINDMQGGA